MLLGPFFALIRSPLSNGPITSAALSALHSFFVCNLISANSISVGPALIELSSTVSHCKFEASDSSGDEVVLLKIMTIILDCVVSSSVGGFLGDVEVCEMLETILTTACQMRLSGVFEPLFIRSVRSLYYTEILRRSAESTMISIVRTIFSRLHTLDPAAEEARLLVNEEEPQHGEINMTVSTNAADTGDFLSQESEGVTSTGQENAASVTLKNAEHTAAAGVEVPSQTPSTPRPCKLPHLVLCFGS